MSQCGDLILAPLLKVVEERAMAAYREDVKIVLTGLGDDIGLYGAVALVLQNYEEARLRKTELKRPGN